MYIPDNQLNFLVAADGTFVTQLELYNADGTPCTQYADAEWRATFAKPGAVACYTTTTANWEVVNDYTRILTIPAADTADFPAGNLEVDIDLIVSPTVRYPLVRRAVGSVTPKIPTS